MVTIGKENTAPMDEGTTRSAPGPSRPDIIAMRISNLENQNMVLERRCNNLETKLDDLLKMAEFHAELIQALQMQNDALKTVIADHQHESDSDAAGSPRADATATEASSSAAASGDITSSHDATSEHADGELDNEEQQQDVQPRAESSSSGLLLDGSDYDIASSYDWLVDDLDAICTDAQAFKALLAARMPKSSFAGPLAGLCSSERDEVIRIFTGYMQDALPQLQARWCMQSGGLLAAICDLESTESMRRLQSSGSRLRLQLDMLNMEHKGNTGAQWQEAVKGVVNTVVASEGRNVKNVSDDQSRRHDSIPATLVAIRAIPDLRNKIKKAFMTTEYAEELCMCQLKHRVASLGLALSADELWATAGELFDSLPGVKCSELRNGQVHRVLDWSADVDEGTESSEEDGDDLSTDAGPVLLSRARLARALAAESQLHGSVALAGEAPADSVANGCHRVDDLAISIAVRAAAAGSSEQATKTASSPSAPPGPQENQPWHNPDSDPGDADVPHKCAAAEGPQDGMRSSAVVRQGGDAAHMLEAGERQPGTPPADAVADTTAAADPDRPSCGTAPPVEAAENQDAMHVCHACRPSTGRDSRLPDEAATAQQDGGSGDAAAVTGPTAEPTITVLDEAAQDAPERQGNHPDVGQGAVAHQVIPPHGTDAQKQAAAASAPSTLVDVLPHGGDACMPPVASELGDGDQNAGELVAEPEAAGRPDSVAGGSDGSGGGADAATRVVNGADAAARKNGAAVADAAKSAGACLPHSGGGQHRGHALTASTAAGHASANCMVGSQDVLGDSASDSSGKASPKQARVSGAGCDADDSATRPSLPAAGVRYFSGSGSSSGQAAYWAAAQLEARAAAPRWLEDGMAFLAQRPVTEVHAFCNRALELVVYLQGVPHHSGLDPTFMQKSNGTLVAFVAPAPDHKRSQGLFDASDVDDGASFYVMLQEPRPLQPLSQALYFASRELERLTSQSLATTSLCEASPEVLSMLKKCTAFVCSHFPCLAHVLWLRKGYKGTSVQHVASNPLLQCNLTSHIRALELEHVLQPLFTPSGSHPMIQLASIDTFYGAGRGGITNRGRSKVKQLLHHATVWHANMRVAAFQMMEQEGGTLMNQPVMEAMSRRSLCLGRVVDVEAGLEDICVNDPSSGSANDESVVSPLARLKQARVRLRGNRTSRGEMCRLLCNMAGRCSNPRVAMAALRRAARNSVAHLCQDTLCAGGLLPIALAQQAMSSKGCIREVGHHGVRSASEVLGVDVGADTDPAAVMAALKRSDVNIADVICNVDVCVWRAFTPGICPRLYWIYQTPEGRSSTTMMYHTLEHRTCADQLPGISDAGAKVEKEKRLLTVAAEKYVVMLGGQLPAARRSMGEAPQIRTEGRIHPQTLLPPLAAGPGYMPAASPHPANTSSVLDSDSDAQVAVRKRCRGSDADSDYVASYGEDFEQSPLATVSEPPVPPVKLRRIRLVPVSPQRQMQLEELMAGGMTASAPVERVGKASGRMCGRGAGRKAGGRLPGGGTSRASRGRDPCAAVHVAVHDDMSVQAVIGKSLDAVPLFRDSQQAMIPRAVKERLKPWQVDGVRHLFTTIILDHDSEMWQNHRKEVLAARLSQGDPGAVGEMDDETLPRGGAILAHTMGSGKTLQSIILALLFMAVRAKQRKHSRVVILVPTNVQYNWMDELRHWLGFFTTNGVNEQDGHLSLETPDLRVKAWMLEGASKLGPIQQWHEHGAVPSAKTAAKREQMLLRKVSAGACMRDSMRPHGSILVTTHGGFRRLWHNGQADGSGGTQGQEALQRVTQGAGLVIMDEAHCIRNQRINLSKAVSSFATPRRIALTGYPLMNSVDEYFHMISWACPDFLGEKKEFDKQYKEPIEIGRRVGATRQEHKRMLRQSQLLRDLVGPILHRVTAAELGRSLPTKVEAVIAVRLPEMMTRLYQVAVAAMHEAQVAFLVMANLVNVLLFNPEQFLATMKALAAGNPAMADLEGDAEIADFGDADNADGSDAEPHPAQHRPAATAPAPATAQPRHKAASDGKAHMSPHQAQSIVAAFEDILGGQRLTLTDSPKARLVLHLVQDAVSEGRKVLVFVTYLDDLHTLQQHCTRVAKAVAAGKKVLIKTMSGSTRSADRREHVAEFNAHQGPGVFVMTTRACGVGINLTAATRAIMPFPNFNPSHESQAAARIHRLGQQNTVEIFRIVCDGAFDHTVMKIAMEKEAMARVVVDGQGVKALMERDKANFELRPTLDADPLEGLDASQHRSVLQGVVEGAAAAKCTVATIQLWNELLAEDKGMKINKESRNKLLRKVLATQSDGAFGGNRFTQRQMAALRRSQRKQPAAQGAGGATVVAACDDDGSGVELSSDDDFAIQTTPVVAAPACTGTRPHAISGDAAAAAASLAAAHRSMGSNKVVPQLTAGRGAMLGSGQMALGSEVLLELATVPLRVGPTASQAHAMATGRDGSQTTMPNTHAVSVIATPAVGLPTAATTAAPELPPLPARQVMNRAAVGSTVAMQASMQQTAADAALPFSPFPMHRPPSQAVVATMQAARDSSSQAACSPGGNNAAVTAQVPAGMFLCHAAMDDAPAEAGTTMPGERVSSAVASASPAKTPACAHVSGPAVEQGAVPQPRLRSVAGLQEQPKPAAGPIAGGIEARGMSTGSSQQLQTVAHEAGVAQRGATVAAGGSPRQEMAQGGDLSRRKMSREEWERHRSCAPIHVGPASWTAPVSGGSAPAMAHKARRMAGQPPASGHAVQARSMALKQGALNSPGKTPTKGGSGRGKYHCTPGSCVKGMHTLPELGYRFLPMPVRGQAACPTGSDASMAGGEAVAVLPSSARPIPSGLGASDTDQQGQAAHAALPQSANSPWGAPAGMEAAGQRRQLRPGDDTGAVWTPGSGYREEGALIVIDDEDD